MFLTVYRVPMEGSSLILPLWLTGAKNVQYRYKRNIISPHSLIFPNDIKTVSIQHTASRRRPCPPVYSSILYALYGCWCVCGGGGGGGEGDDLHINTLIVKLCNKNFKNVIFVLIKSQYFPVWP